MLLPCSPIYRRVGLLAMATPQDMAPKGTEMYLAGWGNTDGTDGSRSNVLKWVCFLNIR